MTDNKTFMNPTNRQRIESEKKWLEESMRLSKNLADAISAYEDFHKHYDDRDAWKSRAEKAADETWEMGSQIDLLKSENERLILALRSISNSTGDAAELCAIATDALLAATEPKPKGKTLVEIFGEEKESK